MVKIFFQFFFNYVSLIIDLCSTLIKGLLLSSRGIRMSSILFYLHYYTLFMYIHMYEIPKNYVDSRRSDKL
jgi:hypothetical protein